MRYRWRGFVIVNEEVVDCNGMERIGVSFGILNKGLARGISGKY